MNTYLIKNQSIYFNISFQLRVKNMFGSIWEKKWIEKYFLFVKLKTIPICKQNYIPKRHSYCFIAKCKLKTKWFEYLYEKEFLILYCSPDTLLAVKLSSSFFSYMYLVADAELVKCWTTWDSGWEGLWILSPLKQKKTYSKTGSFQTLFQFFLSPTGL